MADTGGVFGCHLLGQLKADIEAKFKTGQTQSVLVVSPEVKEKKLLSSQTINYENILMMCQQSS